MVGLSLALHLQFYLSTPEPLRAFTDVIMEKVSCTDVERDVFELSQQTCRIKWQACVYEQLSCRLIILSALAYMLNNEWFVSDKTEVKIIKLFWIGQLNY